MSVQQRRCLPVFNAVALLPAGPSYHPPQFGPEGGGLPALHPAAALRQRRLLHQGVCTSLHRPGHGEELSQVRTAALVRMRGPSGTIQITETLLVFCSKQALVYNCVGCGSFYLQRMGRRTSNGKQ